MTQTAKPWTDFTSDGGSASLKTLYLEKVPKGHKMSVELIAATIYTTNHGDYTTAKYINIGIKRGIRKLYVRGRDIGASDTVVRHNSGLTLYEGDQVFAEFEGTDTTTTYELFATGEIVPLQDK